MSEGSREVVDEARRSKAPLARVAGELLGMSPWKKRLLAGFLLIAAVGAVMRVPDWMNPPAAPAPADRSAVVADDGANADAPANARGFVDESQQPRRGMPPPLDDASAETPKEPLPWTARLGGWLARLGLSFAAGLVLGVFFRAFLKTMAAITAVVIAGIVGLSYFEVLNIDFTSMRQNYDSFAGWLSDQGYRAKDMIVGVLPSFTAAVSGFFVGFIRR